jgi:hypothetical protein
VYCTMPSLPAVTSGPVPVLSTTVRGSYGGAVPLATVTSGSAPSATSGRSFGRSATGVDSGSGVELS